MVSVEQLSQEWLAAKKAEQLAIEKRREVEDKLAQFIDQTKEGTQAIKAAGFKVKAVTRFNRRINADLLQEIAAENGLSDHLGSLFRWKPEINASAWKATNEAITKPLLAAITTTAGRPSFTIEKIEE